MEVITEDGLVSRNVTTVLNKWRGSFNELLNPVTGNRDKYEERVRTEISADHDSILNSAFIDFRKTYDCINRNLLFHKLNRIRLDGRMFDALKSLYKNVQCSVRINGLYTDWFPAGSGLKQGCSLSPVLFNFYINDLVSKLASLDVGISINGEKVCILLYADDVVLLGENEHGLQCLLNALNEWCDQNQPFVNEDKSSIVHFRSKSYRLTNTSFNIGTKVIKVKNQYVYLGLLLSEHLDYTMMAKHVSKSASRALGLVISKYKAFGGLPYNTFTKLFDSIVYSTISYGASILGDRSFSCITAIQNRAARFFMGVGPYTPNVATMGDMEWLSTDVRQ